MITKKYKESVTFDCTEFECEETGAKLQEFDMLQAPYTSFFIYSHNGKQLVVPPDLIESIKKLLK